MNHIENTRKGATDYRLKTTNYFFLHSVISIIFFENPANGLMTIG